MSRKAGFMIGMECESNEADETLIYFFLHQRWSFRRMMRRHKRSLQRREKCEAMKPSHGTVWESLNLWVDFVSKSFCWLPVTARDPERISRVVQ